METVLSSTFGCLTSILNGKAWPQALRAYRMITAALVHDYLKDGPKSYEEIEAHLEDYRKHPTGRLWVDCLIKPTLIALRFMRAEREGDLLLREHCLAEMLPYFFATGHHHYARYITMYLQEVKSLPHEARKDLVKGCHVCRHATGAPAVSSDQFGEQTYIKQGKGCGGLKGISTNAEQVAVWINSFSICAHVSIALDDIYHPAEEQKSTIPADEEHLNQDDNQDDGKPKTGVVHKEEGTKRMNLDTDDCKKRLDAIQKHSHSLLTDSEQLYHIVNGQYAPPEVNFHNAVEIGKQQLDQFIKNLPNGFHRTIEKRVKTMQQMKKAVVVQGKAIYDMEAIFARLLVVGQQRNVDLQYELSAVPPSIVDEFGCLRKGDKSVLVRKCLSITDDNP